MASGPTDIAIIQSRPDPLPSWKWRSDTVTPFGLPYHYVEGIDLPWNNIDIGNKIPRGSGYAYYPGTHDISAVTIVLYEDSDARTLQWLYDWKSKVKDFNTGLYGYPTEYKRNWTFVMCNTKDVPVITAELTGMWPADTSPVQLGYSEAGRIIHSQQFSVDGQNLTFRRG